MLQYVLSVAPAREKSNNKIAKKEAMLLDVI